MSPAVEVAKVPLPVVVAVGKVPIGGVEEDKAMSNFSLRCPLCFMEVDNKADCSCNSFAEEYQCFNGGLWIHGNGLLFEVYLRHVDHRGETIKKLEFVGDSVEKAKNWLKLHLDHYRYYYSCDFKNIKNERLKFQFVKTSRTKP